MTPFQPSKPLRVVLVGSNGKMGRAIQSASAASKHISVVSAIDQTAQTPQIADVVIDFSSDDGARRAIEIALQMNAALLIGTTGLSEKTDFEIQKCSKKISAIKISNSSLGITILTRLASLATTILGSQVAIAIHETHHQHKKDSPSGTAITIANAIRKAGGVILNSEIQSVREGEVIGNHRVDFVTQHDVLSLEHRAISRELFANGALRIADWLRYKPAGLYSADDWLSDLLLQQNKS